MSCIGRDKYFGGFVMKQTAVGGFILLTLGFFLVSSPVQASPVQEQLKATIDQILKILADPDLKGDEKTKQRRAVLKETINKRFSFYKMSQLSLARHWRDRTEQEKEHFVILFGQLLEDTYISKIESYTDEEVVFVKEYVNNKKAQVYTKIITDSVEIPIDYRLYQADDATWMVYDMVIEGVSLVGNYRTQFDQMLQKGSYEDLVKELKNKISS